MTDLDYYLITDHAARARSMLISIAVGVVCAGFAAFLELPDKVVVFACGAATISAEIICALTYVRRGVANYGEPTPLLRQNLIRLAWSAASFAVLVSLRIRPQTERAEEALTLAEQAAKEGSTENAIAHLDRSALLLQTLREEKRPAPPKFFQSSIESLNQLTPQIKKPAFAARVALAEYRSALEPVPQQGTTVNFGPHGTPIELKDGDTISDARFVVTSNGPVFEVAPPIAKTLSQNITILRFTIVGGMQLLDGIHWRNVNFIGTVIEYQGGEVDLINVHFINCTFQLLPTDNGAKVADFAALLSDKLLIRSGTS